MDFVEKNGGIGALLKCGRLCGMCLVTPNNVKARLRLLFERNLRSALPNAKLQEQTLGMVHPRIRERRIRSSSWAPFPTFSLRSSAPLPTTWLPKNPRPSSPLKNDSSFNPSAPPSETRAKIPDFSSPTGIPVSSTQIRQSPPNAESSVSLRASTHIRQNSPNTNSASEPPVSVSSAPIPTNSSTFTPHAEPPISENPPSTENSPNFSHPAEPSISLRSYTQIPKNPPAELPFPLRSSVLISENPSFCSPAFSLRSSAPIPFLPSPLSRPYSSPFYDLFSSAVLNEPHSSYSLRSSAPIPADFLSRRT
eukprot:Phypoly_transcript_05161.p1 GENE.Phypoly_transcript_05161~~Phypoly_transcript_05161.p1  ORF type:complete len:308 (+),score=60.85 Phypoly_transcript_05161:960-1883(+)